MKYRSGIPSQQLHHCASKLESQLTQQHLTLAVLGARAVSNTFPLGEVSVPLPRLSRLSVVHMKARITQIG
jgi:hypothetical protein